MSSPNGIESPPGVPRWVKVSALAVGILVVAVVALLLVTGGSDHGPGRHTPGGEPGELVSPEAPGEHTPPAGGHG
jgi:hypothetical protein